MKPKMYFSVEVLDVKRVAAVAEVVRWLVAGKSAFRPSSKVDFNLGHTRPCTRRQQTPNNSST